LDLRFRPIPEVDVLNITFPLPGFGFLPVNAFVLHAEEPVLIDTGPTLDPTGASNVHRFMEVLGESIEPADIRWIWLTHADQDHVGALNAVLEAAPQARVVTSYLGVGKMGLFNPLPMDRVFLLNPGQSLPVGDRTLTAFRPPSYDAPETTGFFDQESGLLFSSDCFGGLLSSAQTDAGDVPPDALREGQTLWATVDSPWLNRVDRDLLGADLEVVRGFAPRAVFSSHLPPAFDMTDQLLGALEAATEAAPFVGPDQAALTAMLSQITEPPPPMPA
jgi:glyoxylase-like metal-dependent hydrolase (beta-lactamase superfamily II)